MLPDFGDFVASLDVETVNRLARPLVRDADRLILFHPDDPEGALHALRLELSRSEAWSLARSLAVLNLYHEWLKENGSF